MKRLDIFPKKGTKLITNRELDNIRDMIARPDIYRESET